MYQKKYSLAFSMALVFSLSSTALFAQNVGVRCGMNIARFAVSSNLSTEELSFQHRNSYHAGLALDIPLSNHFVIETGLNVSGKGARINYSMIIVSSHFETTHDVNLQYRTTYLDLPIALKWRTDNDLVNFYGLLGGYAGLGMQGKVLNDLESTDVHVDSEMIISWGNTEDDFFRRPDYGALLGAGIQIGHVQLGFSYLHGLANILSPNTSEYYFRNRVLQLSATFYFSKP